MEQLAVIVVGMLYAPDMLMSFVSSSADIAIATIEGKANDLASVGREVTTGYAQEAHAQMADALNNLFSRFE